MKSGRNNTREILFRGKDLETDRWVYGYFVYCAGMYDNPRTDRVADIIPVDVDRIYLGEYNCHQSYEVDINTVGQFTGLVDKNGTKIFEGDIVDTPRWIVTYLANTHDGYGMNAGWYIQRDDFESWKELECVKDHIVLGNIYDNPELLKKM